MTEVSDERLKLLVADAKGDGRPSDWMPINSDEIAAILIELQSLRRSPSREAVLEEAAKVAEGAISASAKVRNELGPSAPINGLEKQLHQIVVVTAKGIASRIRALSSPQPPGEVRIRY